MEYFLNTPGFLYAGDFYIDTGYDDPVATANLSMAKESYSAQAFVTSVNAVPPSNAAEFRCTTEVVFTTVFDPIGGVVNLPRVWLKVTVWAKLFDTSVNGYGITVNSVSWALYKV